MDRTLSIHSSSAADLYFKSNIISFKNESANRNLPNIGSASQMYNARNGRFHHPQREKKKLIDHIFQFLQRVSSLVLKPVSHIPGCRTGIASPQQEASTLPACDAFLHDRMVHSMNSPDDILSKYLSRPHEFQLCIAKKGTRYGATKAKEFCTVNITQCFADQDNSSYSWPSKVEKASRIRRTSRPSRIPKIMQYSFLCYTMCRLVVHFEPAKVPNMLYQNFWFAPAASR
jgi:hypothetical protein